MNASEQQSILTIALLAAFADGNKADSERDAIRQVAEALGAQAGDATLARALQDVLLRRVSLEQATAGLGVLEHRQLAYEMAVCVCDADGAQTAPEKAFLQRLKGLLALGAAETDAIDRDADALVQAAETALPAGSPASAAAAAGVAAAGVAAAALAGSAASAAPDPAGASGASGGAGAASPPAAAASTVLVLTAEQHAELDRRILNASLMNGALELLPQSWASMAIIPLQVRLVYQIGKAHGIELDQGHIREFIAAVGVGITSQYVEQFGRKLLGGLIGKVAGRTLGGIGSAATGMAFSFATTYALGQLAKRYYAGGRVMSGAVLKDSYQQLLAPARQMQLQYQPKMVELSRTLDMNKVLALVRGQ